MSRTDKDAPNWVRALHHPRAEANHIWSCEDSILAAHRHLAPADGFRSCDIDRPAGNCRWYVHDRDKWHPDYPDYDTRHDRYFSPERAHVRVTLREALRDFNTNGDTDIEPVNRQTRGSVWVGGYWD